MAPYVAIGTLETEQMLCTWMTNTFMFLKGMLAVENEVDQTVVGRIKGMGLKLAVLSRETLY